MAQEVRECEMEAGILLTYSPSKRRSQFDAIQSVEEMHLDVGFDQCTVATG
jgi:hypothetical protein